MEGEDARLLGGEGGGTNEEGSTGMRGGNWRKGEERRGGRKEGGVRQNNRGRGFFPAWKRMPATGMRDHGIQHHVTHLC